MLRYEFQSWDQILPCAQFCPPASRLPCSPHVELLLRPSGRAGWVGFLLSASDRGRRRRKKISPPLLPLCTSSGR